MPTIIVDSLVLAFGLDSRQLDKGIQQTSANIKREADKLDAALGNKARGMANNFLMPFKQMIAPLMGALSLGAAVSQYANAADAVGKLSDAIGVNMEDLQAWSEAAARAGGSVQGFQNTIQMFNQRLQATVLAGGKDETSKALQSIGVAAVDASGKARDAFDVLRDMASSAEGLSKAEFKGLAEKLGIDRGTIMLLQSGRKSLDELIQRQKELGVYTKEDAEIAAKFNDATADMMQVIKAASAGVMRVQIPAITFLTEKLTIAVGFVRESSPLILSALGVVATFLTAKFAPAAWTAMAPFIPWAGLIAGVALVLDDLYAYMNGGESVFAEFWSAFGTGEEVQQSINKAWKDFKEILSQVWQKIKPFVPELVKFIPLVLGLGAGFKAINAAVGILTNVASGFGLVTKAVGIFSRALLMNPVGLFLTAMAVGIGLAIANWDKLKAAAIKVADSIKEKWEKVKTFFSDLWDKITGFFTNSINTIKNLFTTDTGASLFTASWDGVTKFFDDLWKSVTGIFEDGYKAVMKIWNMLVGTLMKGVAFVKNLWKGLTGGVKETTEFYAANADTDWEDLAERAANGEDVSGLYNPRPADGISQGGLNAADGKTEQNVTNTTDIKFENVNVTAQSSDPAALSQAFVDGTSSRYGSLIKASQTGTKTK